MSSQLPGPQNLQILLEKLKEPSCVCRCVKEAKEV